MDISPRQFLKLIDRDLELADYVNAKLNNYRTVEESPKMTFNRILKELDNLRKVNKRLLTLIPEDVKSLSEIKDLLENR